MYETRNLEALVEFRHGGLRKPGDKFEATATDAAFLIARGRAKLRGEPEPIAVAESVSAEPAPVVRRRGRPRKAE